MSILDVLPVPVQDDYEDLRNRMEPLSQSVQTLQAEKDALTQQLQQV